MIAHSDTRCVGGLAVAVGTLSLAETGHDVDEATVVLHSSLGAPCSLLFLLLLVHLAQTRKSNYMYATGFSLECKISKAT